MRASLTFSKFHDNGTLVRILPVPFWTMEIFMFSTLDQYFDTLASRFDASEAGDWEASVQFVFDGGFSKAITVNDGGLTVHAGEVADPDTRIEGDGKTWLGIVNGTTNGLMAIFQKKVRVSGNMDNLAMLQKKEVFKR